MSDRVRGYLYLSVCIACIITCAVLIASIFFEIREIAIPQFEMHNPMIEKQIQPQNAAAQGEMLITQDYAAAVITSILPKDLPLSNVGVLVEKSGTIAISGDVTKDDLQDFLEEHGMKMGIKERFVAKFIGQKAQFSAVFAAKTGENGEFILQPDSIKINKTQISLEILPEKYCEKLSTALNEVMRGTGFVYSKIVLRDGAIVLIA